MDLINGKVVFVEFSTLAENCHEMSVFICHSSTFRSCFTIYILNHRSIASKGSL